MRFEILGPTKVRAEDGREVALGGPRVRALLVLLALQAGRIVPAEQLVDDLYGTRPPEGISNALQSQVSRLRRALGKDLVEFHPAGYRLAADPSQVDAHRFEKLAADGRQALGAGDARSAAAVLREALDLWRGAPLSDAPLAEAAATRLEELRLAAVEDRIQADLALGRHRDLVAELRQLISAHPLRERLRAQLMRALYGSGRQAEALTAYEEGRRILDEELGVEPGAEMTAAHLAVLRADPALGGAAEGVTRLGLRSQLTSFIGRADDLERLGGLLDSARLVTLIGPGGAGKTRLATEAAERIPGDVCFVELAPVADATDLARAVLAALGIRDAPVAGPGRPAPAPRERLVAALADRKLLLVLDNCEHLVAAAAELADELLAACPALRVLATSREALAITGESLVPVPPLRLPPPGVPDPLDYPAVRLFADRAAAVRQDFALEGADLELIVGICRALDGLPLAIELAAARLRTLTLADVAERLGDRFRLLTRGSRTALPRHQTLRAVVDWSWDLLDAGEQRLARRLTVFVGGGRVDAAELVSGGGPGTEDVLTSLAEKSLVELVDGRFRMLETIRAYGAERLAEADEVDATLAAHAAYYLELATEADARLRTRDQLPWLTRLDEESDDLHAAIRWAAEAGQIELALRLISRMACYWWMRGHRVVSAQLANLVLGKTGEPPPDGLEEEYATCVLTALADGRATADLARRRELLADRVKEFQLPFRVEFLTMLMPLFTGPPAGYRPADVAPPPGVELSPWTRALTWLGTAFVHHAYDQLDEAAERFERALADFTAIGERWGRMLALGGLQDLRFELRDYPGAIALADQAMALSQELGASADAAENLCRRTDSVLCLGDLDAAEAGYLRAAEQARRIGAPDTLAWAHLGQGEVAARRGRPEAARAYLEQALSECPDGWYAVVDTRTRILLALGRLDLAAGDADAAWRRFATALGEAQRTFKQLSRPAIDGLAATAESRGDGETAKLLRTLTPLEALDLVESRSATGQ
ncbi:BTAD domain-containing putative transcriptional regulator [Nonomuraea endophytica]|uniref:Putative ATPase/DNA-binding SARP family transcriptional activator n=1 Tax=Nonomuraea endophytica TaxID=714136 RepID=A0A7W8A5Z5_9ACTN|nr:BTAD domain-containing putative transcriptional regulator [Nonomuraea endophytica]MBB5079639.1 putative ATPase/DNA-binding SARP family transcriptional activator [Nonomuraea endophytica]